MFLILAEFFRASFDFTRLRGCCKHISHVQIWVTWHSYKFKLKCLGLKRLRLMFCGIVVRSWVHAVRDLGWVVLFMFADTLFYMAVSLAGRFAHHYHRLAYFRLRLERLRIPNSTPRLYLPAAGTLELQRTRQAHINSPPAKLRTVRSVGGRRRATGWMNTNLMVLIHPVLTAADAAVGLNGYQVCSLRRASSMHPTAQTRALWNGNRNGLRPTHDRTGLGVLLECSGSTRVREGSLRTPRELLFCTATAWLASWLNGRNGGFGCGSGNIE
jgi:hypothetical protein